MIDYELVKSDDVVQDMKNLYDVVTFLRDPVDGCPWDREQTPRDMVRSMQDEIYEYIDAMNDGDNAHMSEELGDVFLNLFLLGKIHDQNGDFKLSDCLNEACEKYIRRHPHVFSNVHVDNTEEVLKNWKKIKAEQEGRTEKSFFDGVSESAPELEKCYKISKKAAKAGFDWHDIDGVYDKVCEELDEVKSAQSDPEVMEELGDLLFTCVQIGRMKHIKPTDALSYANNKFIKRFEIVTRLAKADNLELESLTDEQWDHYWNIAKENVNSSSVK